MPAVASGPCPAGQRLLRHCARCIRAASSSCLPLERFPQQPKTYRRHAAGFLRSRRLPRTNKETLNMTKIIRILPWLLGASLATPAAQAANNKVVIGGGGGGAGRGAGGGGAGGGGAAK